VWEFSSQEPASGGETVLSIDEFRAVFAAAPDGVLVVRADGSIRAANEKIEQLFGWSAKELEGKPIEVLVPSRQHAVHREQRDVFLAQPHDRPMGAGLDLTGARRDGTEFPVEVSLSPWYTPAGERQVICSVRDVREYRRLQNFSEGALRASEEERKRISRELHDDTAQRLATLILRVRQLSGESNDAARSALFEEIRSEIVEAADAVKRMARGLRPPELEELGLELALEAHIRDLRESSIFQVHSELGHVDPFLDVTTKLALYRIIQEALSNARKHSGSDSAVVRLTQEDGAVIAEVVDRGKGFSMTAAMDGQRGLGLTGMRERVAMVGGRLVVESAPGEGTRVRVVVRAQAEAKKDD
jgi:PAS domain S-box-containing protein